MVKLLSVEFYGVGVEVVRSYCFGCVGIKGIVVWDWKFVFEIIIKKRGVKVVLKEGMMFCVIVLVVNVDGLMEEVKG